MIQQFCDKWLLGFCLVYVAAGKNVTGENKPGQTFHKKMFEEQDTSEKR
jgi:hypothetical protein